MSDSIPTPRSDFANQVSHQSLYLEACSIEKALTETERRFRDTEQKLISADETINRLRAERVTSAQQLDGMSKRLQAAESINEGYRAMEEKCEETLHQLNAAEKALTDRNKDFATAIEDCNRSREIIYAMSAALEPNEGEHNIDCAKRVAAERTEAVAGLNTLITAVKTYLLCGLPEIKTVDDVMRGMRTVADKLQAIANSTTPKA